MSSPIHLEFETYYHLFSRGNNKEDIFFEDRNYEFFLSQYKKYIEPVADTLAYCLLKNHFHLLVKIKSRNEILNHMDYLVSQEKMIKFPSLRLSHFLNSYAKAINKNYGRSGSLFQHPFRRNIILNNEQIFRSVAYIHQNPVKHQFVLDKWEWKWSSYCDTCSKNFSIVKLQNIIDIFGGVENYLAIEYPINDLTDSDGEI